MSFYNKLRSIFASLFKTESSTEPCVINSKYKYNLLCPKGVASVYNGLLYLYVEDDIFLNPEIHFVLEEYEFTISSYEEIVEMNKKRLSKDIAKEIADIDLKYMKNIENHFFISTDNLELITYIKMTYYGTI